MLNSKYVFRRSSFAPRNRRILAFGAGLGVAAIALTGCAASTDAPEATTPQEKTAAEWSYSGSNGPDHWGEFGGACENSAASHESPIAISTSAFTESNNATDASPVSFNYRAADFELENNGHTIEAVPTDTSANSIERNGITYELQQFHFHATSEHTIDGASAAAELHLVHQSSDGELLVLGVLLNAGDANPALDELFASITDEVSGDEGEPLNTPINPANLIPADVTSVQYSGSLTTPPCTEGVQWNVFTTPATISAEQLADYTDVYPDNHRPVQPLHDREVFAVPTA